MIFEKQDYQQECINNIITLLDGFDFKCHDALNLKDCLNQFHATQSSKNSDLDLGFKVYTLQDKAQIINEKERLRLPSHSNLTPFDKALNLALQCGKTLNCTLETTIKDKLYKCEDAYFCIVCDKEVLEYLAKSKKEMIFLDGYEEMDLQAFLNLNASFKERLSVVY